MQLRKCWAFLVGINKYTDTGYTTLRYCVDDVQSLETLLNSIGYVPVCLHDRLDFRNSRFPTRKNILVELEALLNRVGEKDLLLVYFACHGVRSPEGKPMLIATDTRKRRLAEDAISILDDLEPKIRASKAQQKVMMLDACFIGQGRGEKDPVEFLRKVNELASGFEILSASTEDQEALESSGLKHSIFCHFVLKGLAGEAALPQGAVMLSSLKSYVMAEIAEYTVRLSLDQTPQGRSDGNLGDFMLVDYTTQPRPNLDVLQASDVSQVVSQVETSSIQGRGNSLATKIIESLWSLNYEKQTETFRTSIPGMRSGAIIAVQAENELLQFWLIKRLLRKLPVPVKNAYNECILISVKHVSGSFELFCQALANGLKLESLAPQLTSEQFRDLLIKNLIEQYQTKNIVIVIQDWPQRTSQRRDAKNLLGKIIHEFWQPLRKEISEQCVAPLRYRLILCFMDVKGGNSNLRDLKSEVPNSTDLIDLEPLHILPEELERWILSSETNEVLQELRDDEVESFLADFSSPESSENSEIVIDEICDLCGLKGGIADIEAEWRLAG